MPKVSLVGLFMVLGVGRICGRREYHVMQRGTG